MVRAVFMDRDGTLSEEVGYMYHAGLYKPFPWAGPAVRKINECGMKAVLITNQSGVERGYYPESQVHQIHDILRAELARHEATLDAVYFCPHHPDSRCECRKPRPGMLFQARQELGIDLAQSFVVGDRYLDVGAGHAAGARTILVLTGYGREELQKYEHDPQQPDFLAGNALEAVEGIVTGKFR